jgi:tetratricopeptide (TPR) repeat protein
MEKTTPVITSEDPKRWYQKRNVLIDIAVILAVFLIIGVIWWVGHRPKPAAVSNVPQYTGQTLVDQVNKKYGNHDYIGAIRLIEGQKTVNDTATRLLLAAAYANSGDNQKALQIYEKQDQKKPLSETDAATAASVAEGAKQYQKAINLYQEAKQRANQQNTDQLAVYDYKIGELQKKL